MLELFSFNTLLLIARWAFIGLIYLALFGVLYVVRRELAFQTRRGGASAPRPVAAMAPGRLRVVNPGSDRNLKPGQMLALGLENRLGAERDNDLVLRDAFVSKHHARLWWDGAAWWVEDLGSKNGVQVNGAPVFPGRPLRLENHARIQVGDVQMELAGE